jgi:hypothetical protein
MKKLIIILIAVVAQLSVNAQNKKATFIKVKKDIRKEAKSIEKSGWANLPGDLPISQQLNATFEKQMAEDDSGLPKFIVGSGIAKGATQAAAEMQALELAKLNLLNIMEANVNAVVNTDISNNQITDKEASSITKTLQVATSKVSKKLQFMSPTLKIMRKSNGLYEVRIVIAYNFEMVRKMLQQEILSDETNDLRNKHADFLNSDKLFQVPIRNASEQ